MNDNVKKIKKDKVQTGRRQLQTTHLAKDKYIEYIKDSQKSAVKKEKKEKFN